MAQIVLRLKRVNASSEGGDGSRDRRRWMADERCSFVWRRVGSSCHGGSMSKVADETETSAIQRITCDWWATSGLGPPPCLSTTYTHITISSCLDCKRPCLKERPPTPFSACVCPMDKTSKYASPKGW